jgi:hypothetical protein
VFVVYILFICSLSLSRSLCGTRVLGDTPGLIFVTERERASERARHTKSHVNTIHKNRIISYFTSHIPLKNKITQRPARLCFPPVLFLILLLVAPTHTPNCCLVVLLSFGTFVLDMVRAMPAAVCAFTLLALTCVLLLLLL